MQVWIVVYMTYINARPSLYVRVHVCVYLSDSRIFLKIGNILIRKFVGLANIAERGKFWLHLDAE